ncbi:DUF4274 domain-containing protein [Phytoactinopolyspora limicola]|uniref:DUF4274 domain-containing protein n=1 Tax=Phytoactinopolyspora limicola TaxID=2715536 RepID=UPI001409B3D9|nr:DUF4274 domain-containing protein [Phytoactinopolyspora limicola]
MWPEELADDIAQADNAEELHNIAVFLEDPDPLALVLEHPALDVGTALLAYWRLRRAAIVWTTADALLEHAERLLRSGKLPSVVAYEPIGDPHNEELIRAPRWGIPDVLMRPTPAVS